MTLRLRGHSNMKENLWLLVTLGTIAGLLAGCGATPEPTEPPPTQTPWIVVVTATSKPEGTAKVEPTQTPWIIVATPTPKGTATTPTPKETATKEGVSTKPRPTDTAEPAATAGTEAVPTPAPPTPTNTPDAADLIYPPPALLDPPDGRPVSWKSSVVLNWSAVGELAEDEYYHLHLERRPATEGQEWYGDYVYTKEPEY